MKKKIPIIINADDFGYSKSTNLAIIELLSNGLISDTSLMMNMNSTKEAVDLAINNDKKSLGIHLNVTEGYPVSHSSKVASLLNKNGGFKNIEDLIVSALPEELMLEFDNQIKMFLENGLNLTHIDSHQHLLMSSPKFIDIAIKLFSKYKVPIRTRVFNSRTFYSIVIKHLKKFEIFQIYNLIKSQNLSYHCKVNFDGSFFETNLKIDNLISMVSAKRKEVTEIMVHPGVYIDKDINSNDPYYDFRHIEYNLIISSIFRGIIKDNSRIRLISFSEIEHEAN